MHLQLVQEYPALDFRSDQVAIHFIAQIGMRREQVVFPRAALNNRTSRYGRSTAKGSQWT